MKYRFDEKDPVYASLRDFLLCGADTIEDTPDALVLRYNGVYLGAGCANACEDFRNCTMALALEEGVKNHLISDGFFDDVTPVYQYVYSGPEPALPKSDYTIRKLEEKELSFLLANYHHPCATERHLRERIAAGMLGAFDEDRCVGFIGLHEEDAIGMLEIVPEYRRHGVATLLETAMIIWQLDRGHIPYCHVRTDNIVSMALQESLGFVRAGKPLWWLCKNELYRSGHLN